LKIALMKFGVGKWKAIEDSGCLPTKTIGQMYLQAQRLLGQQSLAEFMGLHLDLEKIWLSNSQKQGPGVMRKYGCIINTEDNMKKEVLKRLKEKNKKRYGLSAHFVSNLHLPKARVKEWLKVLTIEQITSHKSGFSSAEKAHHLGILIGALKRKLVKIRKMQEAANYYKATNLGVVVQRCYLNGLASEPLYEYVDTVEIKQGGGDLDALDEFAKEKPKKQPRAGSKASLRTGLDLERLQRTLQNVEEEEEYDGGSSSGENDS